MERDLNSLKKDFFDNGMEIVQDIEETILKLEEDTNNPEYLNSLFRGFHTLKGNSGIVGEKELNKLFHTIESKLDPIRKGKDKITPEITDRLLEVCDLLKNIFSKEDSSDFKNEIERESELFENMINKKTGEEKLSTPPKDTAVKRKSSITASPTFTHVSDLRISKESFKRFITSFANILEYSENLSEDNPDELNIEILENIAIETINFRTEIIESLSECEGLNKLSKYLEKLMFLINRNVTTFDRISFEILFTIISDLKIEVLRSLRLVPLIHRISVNELSEIETIKENLSKDKYNIVELLIPPDLLISNSEKVAKIGIAVKGNHKVGFLYRYSNAINKLTTFLRESLEDFPIIQSNYFALLKELLKID